MLIVGMQLPGQGDLTYAAVSQPASQLIQQNFEPAPAQPASAAPAERKEAPESGSAPKKTIARPWIGQLQAYLREAKQENQMGVRPGNSARATTRAAASANSNSNQGSSSKLGAKPLRPAPKNKPAVTLAKAAAQVASKQPAGGNPWAIMSLEGSETGTEKQGAAEHQTKQIAGVSGSSSASGERFQTMSLQ